MLPISHVSFICYLFLMLALYATYFSCWLYMLPISHVAFICYLFLMFDILTLSLALALYAYRFI